MSYPNGTKFTVELASTIQMKFGASLGIPKANIFTKFSANLEI